MRIDAVNWTGFQKTDESPDALWGGARTYTSMLDQIKALGFNAVRLPLSNAILDGQPAKNSTSKRDQQGSQRPFGSGGATKSRRLRGADRVEGHS